MRIELKRVSLGEYVECHLLKESFYFLISTTCHTTPIQANEPPVASPEMKRLLASLHCILLADVEEALQLFRILKETEWVAPSFPWLGTIYATELMLSLCSLQCPSLVQEMKPRIRIVPLDTPVSLFGLFELTALFSGGWMGAHCNWRIMPCHHRDFEIVYISPKTQIQCLLWKPLALSAMTEAAVGKGEEEAKERRCILLWNPAPSLKQEALSHSIEDQFHALRAFIVNLVATAPSGSILYLISKTILFSSTLSLLHLFSAAPQTAPCAIKVSRKWKKAFDWINVHSEALSSELQNDLYDIDHVLQGNGKLPFPYQIVNGWLRLERGALMESGKELRIVDVEDWHTLLLASEQGPLATPYYSIVIDPDLYPTPRHFAMRVMEQRCHVNDALNMSYAPLLLDAFCQESGIWVTDEKDMAEPHVRDYDIRARGPGETLQLDVDMMMKRTVEGSHRETTGIQATLTAELASKIQLPLSFGSDDHEAPIWLKVKGTLVTRDNKYTIKE